MTRAGECEVRRPFLIVHCMKFHPESGIDEINELQLASTYTMLSLYVDM